MQTFTLTFLGCGSGIYSELGNNNVLLESAAAHTNLLIDCGFITAPELEQTEYLAKIQNALVTHVHADHVGGFEYWGYLNRYVYHHRPNLYFHGDVFDELWHGTLRGGLQRSQNDEGNPEELSLSDYYEPHPLKTDETILIAGLPEIRLRQTLHVKKKPAISLFIGELIYYSSDTVELPPERGPTGRPLEAVFQDCQLFEGPSNVHISIFRLAREIPPQLKKITYLMHYGRGYDRFNPEEMGFAGFVKPGQLFEFRF
ncbi:MAG: hypothetical protein HY692_03890 [Cyanobacteria bacterium NC_groundwater_1444_Ag_S-0.65um_54_12]|nr:hypothetical protein [Cyanobacteria bacterium NC_groundwater_1444_Ag_S-0.65um_54_12]